MILQRFENLIRKILPVDRHYFNKMCDGLNLGLDYRANADAYNIFRSIFVEREYAEYFPFGADATVIDIGGHYGYFALFAAMNTGANAQIISYEPSPLNFKQLEQNINASTFKNILSHQIAVTDKSGSIDVYDGKSFNHTVLPSGGGNKMASIPSITLTQIIDNYTSIDFLKIDAEGSEYEILLNTSSDSLAHVQVISLEFHDRLKDGLGPAQLINHLKASHFRIAHYKHSSDNSYSNNVFGRIVAVSG